MPWHGLQIVSDKNSILARRDRQHLRVENAFQACLVRGKKVHCRFVPSASLHDDKIEVGIRQESNHSSAAPRQHLPPHPLKLLNDIGRRRIRRNPRIFRAPTLLNHLLHLVLVVQVEADRTLDLL